jgi:hypothetical protein
MIRDTQFKQKNNMKARKENLSPVVFLSVFLSLFAGCDGDRGELSPVEEPVAGNSVEKEPEEGQAAIKFSQTGIEAAQ